MNWTRFLAVAAVVVGLGSIGAHAADVFEGKVEMKVLAGKGMKEQATLQYSVKAPKVRMQIAGGSQGREFGGMILDYKAKVLYILMEQEGQKMYMKRPLGEGTEGHAEAKGEEDTPVATGRTETILGYEAAEYVITRKDKSSSQFWLAKGLGNFLGDFNTGEQGPQAKNLASAALKKLAEEKGLFPVRVVNVNAKGKETERMELTKIEPGKVSDATFSLDGYKEFSLSGMMGGFGGR